MKPSYLERISEKFTNDYQNSSKEFKFIPIKDEFDSDNIRKSLQLNPNEDVVALSTNFSYIKNKIVQQYLISDSSNLVNTYGQEYDYINTLPLELYPQFSIYSTDLTRLSLLEEYIQSLYTQDVTLFIEHPLMQGKQISFKMAIDKDYNIKRGVNKNFLDRPVYISMIRLIADNCVSCTEKYSAAQLELDKTVVPGIIERLAALEDIKALLIERDSVNNAKIEAIDTAWKALNETIDSLQGITTYHHLYEVMKNNDCNEQKALEIIRKEQEQEARREAERQKRLEEQEKKKQEAIQYAEKMYTKKGDEVLNRYTDTIVEDIKNRLSLDFPVFVYGGSSFSECLKAEKIGELQYPCIIVWDAMDFTLENKTYQNVDGNGEAIGHSFDKDVLPINYWINIRIFAEEEKQVSLLNEQICALYEQEFEIEMDEEKRLDLESHGIKAGKRIESEMTINIPDPKVSGEFYPLKIGLDIVRNFENKNDDWIYFRKYPCVYHVKDYDKEDVCDNQRLQLRLMQQALFLSQCSVSVSNAVQKFNRDFVNLTTKKTSTMGSLFKSVLHSKEYNMLKECFEQGRPIERDLFEAVFSDTVKVFPSLYDKLRQGWSFERMSGEMQEYADYFRKRFTFLCNQLDVPEGEYLPRFSFRSGKALAFYINEMAKRADCTVAGAIAVYKVRAKAEYDELERRNQEEMERRAQEREERREQGSSGGGFFSSMLGTAGGVALGNKISQRKSKKEVRYVCPNNCRGFHSVAGNGKYSKYSYKGCYKDPKTCGYGLPHPY